MAPKVTEGCGPGDLVFLSLQVAQPVQDHARLPLVPVGRGEVTCRHEEAVEGVRESEAVSQRPEFPLGMLDLGKAGLEGPCARDRGGELGDARDRACPADAVHGGRRGEAGERIGHAIPNVAVG